jgi:hypothetical protein
MNRIELKYKRIEADFKLGRIGIKSASNRIGSNHTSPPGDFLFQFDSSHIISVWYHNTSQEVQIESKQIDLKLN